MHNIKYSIIMPYYKRPELDITLNSYSYYYKNKNDFEVIIIEDSKNYQSEEDHNNLINIIKKYENINITTFVDLKESYNPASKYNKGVEKANGDIIILTSPEIVHLTDILIRVSIKDVINTYITCACLSVQLIEKSDVFVQNKFKTLRWYQHSIYRNAKYHFCSLISKENYIKIGGFNEIFCNGIAYEDDNFVKRVEKILPIISRDDLITYHIEHDRSYSISRFEYLRLTEINKKIWENQIKTNNF